jgi:restriction system protein
VHWAKTYLKSAGLVAQPARGIVQITDRGRDVLASSPDRIDVDFLDRFDEFRNFRARSVRSTDGPEVAGAKPEVTTDRTTTPEERIEAAAGELSEALRRDLLERVLQASPAFFERLVLDLVLAMGYGGSRDDAARRLGRSGDGGLDGLIQEDRLGLDRIYLQAKRYSVANRVGRPTLQEFAGALHGQGAQKGIFITTSDFTSDAREFVARLGQMRIALINGDALTSLMIQHDVGVRVARAVELKRVDLDYFEDEEGGVA